MSDDNKSHKKKGGFISTQDMWELSLDMVGDDDIDPMQRTGEVKKTPVAKKPAKAAKAPKKPVESKAKVLPATTQQRKKKQAVSAKPKVAPRKTVDKKKVTPVEKPPGLVAFQQQGASKSTTARKIPKEPPVISQGKKVNTPAHKKVTKASNAETQKPRAKRTAPAKTTESPMQQTGRHQAFGQPERQMKSGLGYDDREGGVSRRINLDDDQDDNFEKEMRRENFLKVAGGIWSILDYVWVLVSRVVSITLGALPFLYRKKMIILAAAGFFALGIYIGGGKDLTDDPVISEKAVDKKVSGSKKKIVARKKTAKKKSSKKRAVKQREVIKPVVETEVVSAEHPVDNIVVNDQFSGRDIPFADEVAPEENLAGIMPEAETVIGPLPEQAAAFTEEEIPAVLTSDQQAEIQSLFNKNVRMLDKNNWPEVVNLSKQILEIDPRHISALINRSIAYTELGSYDEAIADSNAIIDQEKENAVAYNNRGYAYERAGLIEQAISDYAYACQLGVPESCQEAEKLRRTSAESDEE